MTFLDTNVLVYAADDTDVAKHGRAYELVVRAIKGDAFMVSAQVLNEFAFVMYKKFKRTDDEVAAYLRFFGPIRTVSLEPQFSRRAIEKKSGTDCSIMTRCCSRRPKQTGAKSFVPKI